MIYIGINKYTKIISQYHNKINKLINKYDKTTLHWQW